MLDLNFLSVLDEKAEFLYRFSDDIWAHPETAFTEFHAAERYCAVLRSEGFAVTEGLAGIPTAFSGRFGSGRPVIGILAEFDALSGLSQEGGLTEQRSAGGDCGHGCGHNLLGMAAPGHSWQTVTQGVMPLAHKMTLYAAKSLAALGAELMVNAGLLAQAKQEHRRLVGPEGYVCPIPQGVRPRSMESLHK